MATLKLRLVKLSVRIMIDVLPLVLILPIVLTSEELTDNRPSIFINGTTSFLNVSYGSTVVIDLKTYAREDFDAPEKIQYRVITNLTEFNLVNGVFHWSVGKELRYNDLILTFTLHNTLGLTTRHEMTIFYCGCEHISQCDYTSYNKNSSDLVYKALCNCSEYTSGLYCEKEEDPCKDYHCYTTCNETVSRRMPSWPCDDCPKGRRNIIVNKIQTCENINECTMMLNPCDQVCNDTDGSYICGCNAGYSLNLDKHTCDDIDECSRNTSFCLGEGEVCYNIPGNYSCICRRGYVKREGKCNKLNNIPPVFINGTPTFLNVSYGSTKVIDFKKYARDDFDAPEQIQYQVITNLNEFNLVNGVFDWTVGKELRYKDLILTFILNDTYGFITLHGMTILYCGCEYNSQCVYGSYNKDSSDIVKKAMCNCPEFTSGLYCETEKDPCDDFTCYITCNKTLSRTLPSWPCIACPKGRRNKIVYKKQTCETVEERSPPDNEYNFGVEGTSPPVKEDNFDNSIQIYAVSGSLGTIALLLIIAIIVLCCKKNPRPKTTLTEHKMNTVSRKIGEHKIYRNQLRSPATDDYTEYPETLYDKIQ